jgi:hypothetical protein
VVLQTVLAVVHWVTARPVAAWVATLAAMATCGSEGGRCRQHAVGAWVVLACGVQQWLACLRCTRQSQRSRCVWIMTSLPLL